MSKPTPTTRQQGGTCRTPIDALLAPEFFKALCDRTRIKLLAALVKCGRACSVTEIAECASVDFSVVSRHLVMLEKAGILEAAKTGRTVFYTVRYTEICDTFRALANAIEDCCSATTKAESKKDCCGRS